MPLHYTKPELFLKLRFHSRLTKLQIGITDILRNITEGAHVSLIHSIRRKSHLSCSVSVTYVSVSLMSPML